MPTPQGEVSVNPLTTNGILNGRGISSMERGSVVTTVRGTVTSLEIVQNGEEGTAVHPAANGVMIETARGVAGRLAERVNA